MEKSIVNRKRSTFSGKIGFVFAAAGSAVGLGNIWRFPYLAARYGGGIFLLVYALLSVTFGFSLMVAEIAIGRKSGKSAISAFGALSDRFKFLGVLASFAPMLILPYYSVIGGWVLKYFFGFLAGGASTLAGSDFFEGYISKTGEPLLWFAVFAGFTALIVLFGVERGIEKVSRTMMPVLIVIILGISIYSVISVDGALQGVIYYVMPDFSRFSVMTLVAALGQLFYSMSLAMGVMITFGSYINKDVSIEKSVKQIELFDTSIAFLSGLMIIPAVFAFSGGDEAALDQGAGLMFVTLPKVFLQMPGGAVIGGVFFFMVFLAALTSSISMMETIVSVVMDKLKTNRSRGCLVVFVLVVAFGVPSLLGYSLWSGFSILGMRVLDFFDFLGNGLLMPLVALLTCIFVGYALPRGTIENEVEIGGEFKQQRLYRVVMKYVAPACILVILASSLLNVFGVLDI